MIGCDSESASEGGIPNTRSRPVPVSSSGRDFAGRYNHVILIDLMRAQAPPPDPVLIQQLFTASNSYLFLNQQLLQFGKIGFRCRKDKDYKIVFLLTCRL